MTVTALDVRDEYTATAGQTVFNYTFLIFTANDLNVFITPAGQDANDSTDLTTAYTVDPGTIGNPVGGFITLNTGVSVGDLVTIVSNIVEDRTTDYQNSGDFLPDTVNADFDRVVSLTKQTSDRAGRTLAFQESLQNATELTLPSPKSGSFLVWNPAETGLINSGAPGVIIASETLGSVASMIADSSLLAGDVIFTLGYNTSGDGGNNQYVARTLTGATKDGGSLIASIGNPAIEFVGLFPGGLINQVQFGAIGDDSFNNTPVFQALFDYAATLDRIEIKLLPGVYLMDAKSSVSASTFYFRVSGSGVDATIIKASATNTTGCFEFAFTDRESIATFSDMTFLSGGEGTGTALSLSMDNQGNRHNRSAYLNNIEVKGEAFQVDYWLRGISLVGMFRPLITGVLISGPFGPGVSDDLSDSSPQFSMNVALDVSECYTPEMENCYFFSAKILILASETAGGTESEGFRLSRSVLNGCKSGLQYLRTNREPLIWIRDCHVNFRDIGLDIDGASLVYISGMNMFNQDSGGVSPADNPFDIQLRNSEKVTISDSMFHFNGNDDRININLNAIVFCDDVHISNNIFNSNSTSGTATNGIRIGSGCTDITMFNNNFPGNYGKDII